MNGIIVIDKAAGMTSADVVYKLRKLLHIRRIGHAGTLDPDVTGVLPIAIGQATKLIELMHTKPKAYEGTGIFGFSTDSYDISGTVLQRKEITTPFTAEEIQKGMDEFVGKIIQIPPIYSAVKVNGKHLYEYAREGIEVERPKRQVEVFSYKLGKTNYANMQQEFTFSIKSSKGTYVRSLVNDLGVKLGAPAVMKSLRRTESSGFSLTNSVPLNELESNPDLVEKYLLPIDYFFRDYAKFDLKELQWQKVKNGNIISLPTNEKTLALRYNGKVKAIYKLEKDAYHASLMLLQNE